MRDERSHAARAADGVWPALVKGLGAVAVLVGLLAAPASRAVIIASRDATGNTIAPGDDPGWANAVRVGSLSGVYLGRGWVLTARHVGPGPIHIDGTVYNAIPDSEVGVEADGSRADLTLFRIHRDPGLPDLLIRRSRPIRGTELVMIGFGRNPGSPASACDPPRTGWLWGSGASMRWGTNVVEHGGLGIPMNSTFTRTFTTSFSQGDATEHEAQAAKGDSGGPVFIKNGAGWELAGIMVARNVPPCQPSASTFYGNLTYAADLSHYAAQIEEISSVPACADGIDDDGDGLVDREDPGCRDLDDPFETSDAIECDDGIDNDKDGLSDTDDPGCRDPAWGLENPRCDDGLDNDEDGLIDWDGGGSGGPDPSCVYPWQDSEVIYCGLGFELTLPLIPMMWLRRRRFALGPTSATH